MSLIPNWSPGEGIEILSEFSANAVLVLYLVDRKTRNVGLTLVPLESLDRMVNHRPSFWGTPAWTLDSLVQLKCVGDSYPSLFCQGKTMRNSASTSGLRHAGQSVHRADGETSVITLLEHEKGYRCEHILKWREGESFFECTTTFINTGREAVTLEMLSSFSLGGLTPFAADEATGRLLVHRFRSAWCAEGRLETLPVEKLQLEGFNYPNVATVERFGQVGSMPVRGWFPFAAIEDREAGVIWGAQLAVPGSWQMEICRRDDMINLSGGQADREFGHWTKTVLAGEKFTPPAAILSVCSGDLEKLTAQMLAWQERAPILPVEEDLPVIFNEWCTTWGKPTHEKISAIADRLKGSGVRYFVIDAGWFQDQGGWIPREDFFPEGLKATSQKIRDCGMIPGIWFEFETCVADSPSALENQDHLLKRDGIPIQSLPRWFWDFRDPWVEKHLSERMIDLLEDCGFGYLKIDYNDTIGIGCEGAESLGEGLRQHLEGVRKFWKKIRQRLPDLVIENCSSGGHRLEPSMMALADMASFSDAHETTDIPIVAANLQSTILPKKSQIWAVLRKKDDERRLIYSLTATLLGRMALSGDITELETWQWKLVERGMAFYGKAKEAIRNGISRRLGSEILSYRNPKGWQAVVRSNPREALVVCHGFGGDVPAEIEVELPAGVAWKISDFFQSGPVPPEIQGGKLRCRLNGDWSSCSVILKN